ncbi:MAG: lamin tail domain-containing protein [Pirellulaceae bacterium]|nr:lamin tail domain-containing protein [Pirellulaceae bacterium]
MADLNIGPLRPCLEIGRKPGKTKIVPNGIRIIALLPNPRGTDAGNEQVTIGNSTKESVNLRGWKLIDRAGNMFSLDGKIDSKKSLLVTMREPTMPLNNNGDEVLLVDTENVARSRVRYTMEQVRSGVLLQFAK